MAEGDGLIKHVALYQLMAWFISVVIFVLYKLDNNENRQEKSQTQVKYISTML